MFVRWILAAASLSAITVFTSVEFSKEHLTHLLNKSTDIRNLVKLETLNVNHDFFNLNPKQTFFKISDNHYLICSNTDFCKTLTKINSNIYTWSYSNLIYLRAYYFFNFLINIE
jgi:hypothetical protein